MINKITPEYLRGFFDGEGCVCLNNRGTGQIGLLHTHKELFEAIVDWFREHDYSLSVCYRDNFKPPLWDRLPQYRLDIQEYRSIEKFFNEIGTCRTDRWQRWLEIKEAKYRKKKINYPIYRKRPVRV